MVSAAPIRPHFSAKVQTAQDLVQVVLVSTQESTVRFLWSVRPVSNYMHPLKKKKDFYNNEAKWPKLNQASFRVICHDIISTAIESYMTYINTEYEEF
jgi:hypothetical protein